MNCAFLKDKLVVKQLRQQWMGCPSHIPFFGKLKKVTKWYKELCLCKAVVLFLMMNFPIGTFVI
jgi:hypothetical protein